MKEWLKQNWMAILVLVLGMSWISYLNHRQVPQTKESTEVLTNTVVITKTIYKRVVETKIRVVTDRETLPGGTVKEHIEETTDIKDRTDAGSDSVAKEDSKTRLEKEVNPYQPQWHLTILGGGFVNAAEPLHLQPTFGLVVERRLIGPFWAGVWGYATLPVSGAAGLSLALEL